MMAIRLTECEVFSRRAAAAAAVGSGTIGYGRPELQRELAEEQKWTGVLAESPVNSQTLEWQWCSVALLRISTCNTQHTTGLSQCDVLLQVLPSDLNTRCSIRILLGAASDGAGLINNVLLAG
jgi:hypothetical protein